MCCILWIPFSAQTLRVPALLRLHGGASRGRGAFAEGAELLARALRGPPMPGRRSNCQPRLHGGSSAKAPHPHTSGPLENHPFKVELQVFIASEPAGGRQRHKLAHHQHAPPKKKESGCAWESTHSQKKSSVLHLGGGCFRGVRCFLGAQMFDRPPLSAMGRRIGFCTSPRSSSKMKDTEGRGSGRMKRGGRWRAE